MTTIITTTGLSLQFNTARFHKTKDPTTDQMRQYLRISPKESSAEANSLLRIAGLDDDLMLLHTSEPQAALCAELLKEFFNGAGYKYVSSKEIDFQASAPHIRSIGTQKLINAIIDEIEKAQKDGKEVTINATAGFKIEVIYSTMIGMAYQIPVKYIYEHFDQIITLIPVPIIWDIELFMFNKPFFLWLQDTLRENQEVERRLRTFPEADREKIHAMLEEEDGYTFLSPMGEVFFRRCVHESELIREITWPPDAIETDATKKLPDFRRPGHHYPKGTSDVARKIAKEKWVEEITTGNFENTTNIRVKALGDMGMILVLWADKEKAARLMIRTTARGRPQTYKVTERIKEIVEEF